MAANRGRHDKYLFFIAEKNNVDISEMIEMLPLTVRDKSLMKQRLRPHYALRERPLYGYKELAEVYQLSVERIKQIVSKTIALAKEWDENR